MAVVSSIDDFFNSNLRDHTNALKHQTHPPMKICGPGDFRLLSERRLEGVDVSYIGQLTGGHRGVHDVGVHDVVVKPATAVGCDEVFERIFVTTCSGSGSCSSMGSSCMGGSFGGVVAIIKFLVVVVVEW